jgi:hypothetical protein
MRLRASCAALILVLAAPAAAQEAAQGGTPPLRRWLEIDFARLAMRYRFIENSDEEVTSNQLQHREQFRLRFKFDARGRYAIHAGIFTGSGFTSSWNPTGVGTGDPTAAMRLKQLFAAAAPVDGVVVQAGGLYVVRGEQSEITSYDQDAFIMGERIAVTRPDDLWLDEIAVTIARLDDLTQPNVTDRWDHLGDPNYGQLLVRKDFGRLGASTDFTVVEGARTLRAAVSMELAPFTARLEGYRRFRVDPDGGFALTLERAVGSAATISGGYATIDPAYGSVNGDRFDIGRRLFASTNLTFTEWLDLDLFVTRAVANDFPVSIGTRFDAVLTYDLLHSLRRTGIF